ncbi:MAG TPA: hypothetical protein VE869_05565 [Gemmatimonas sp.]|nr:hypothetical protein [Gemmatimonas sp.]
MLLSSTSNRIRRIHGTSAADLDRFLFTRGLWLVFLKFTVVRVVVWRSASPALLAVLQVLSAIGIAMIVLAAVVRLPTLVVGLVGLAIVLGHNLLDAVTVTGW